MRTIGVALYIFFYVVLLLPRLVRAKLRKARGRDAEFKKLVDDSVRNWAHRMLRVVGAEVTAEGLHNLPETPAVYIANHQSIFDVPIFLSYVKVAGMLSKIELKKVPVFSFWMVALGCVFVDRKDRNQAMRALGGAADSIKAGNSFVVFPEGTRSRGEEVAPFKHGAATIAAMAGAPIVPVVIDGSYRLFEGNQNKIKGAKVRIQVLPPVEVKGLTSDQRKALLSELREQIVRAKDAGKA